MDAAYFRAKAERCRLTLSITVDREVKEQIRLWAREFDNMADAIEEREDMREHDEHEVVR